ncbi:MAG TPA: 50S ribosomal protein L9 [Candidatus Moranbacteria bacterium]|nr:50S ribosomal protein L9 [Candidatus Moranbacteria bacterium]
MKIVLLEEVKNVGKKGEVKEVSDGFARNFLLPRQLAEPANEANIARAEAMREKIDQLNEKELSEKRALADKLKGKKIVIKAKSENGKLFGAITKKQIAQELSIADESTILLENAIKELGDFVIKVRLAENIETEVKLTIESD